MWKEIGKKDVKLFDENKDATVSKKEMLKNSLSKDMFVEGTRVRGTVIGKDEKGKARRWFRPREDK